MRKIVLIISLVFVSFGSFWVAFANVDQAAIETLEQTDYNNLIQQWISSEQASQMSWYSPTTLTVRVTEKVPWANCTCAWNTLNWVCYWPPNWFDNYPPAVWDCTIERWFGTVKSTLWSIIKYLTYITWLAWVLYIIINWIMLSMSWLEQSMKDTAKKNIKKVLVWLLLLLLSWVILNLIAPWIYQ